MPNIPCSHITSILDNSLKKPKFRKIVLILNSKLDELFKDTTHISLWWIYRSAEIVWTKKPIWAYSSSPHKWGRNNKRTIKKHNNWSIKFIFFLRNKYKIARGMFVQIKILLAVFQILNVFQINIQNNSNRKMFKVVETLLLA